MSPACKLAAALRRLWKAAESPPPIPAYGPGGRPVFFREKRARDRAVLRALTGGDLRLGDARRRPPATAAPPVHQLPLPLVPGHVPPREDVPDAGFDPRVAHSARWGEGARAPHAPHESARTRADA